jgi:hypothetical protein
MANAVAARLERRRNFLLVITFDFPLLKDITSQKMKNGKSRAETYRILRLAVRYRVSARASGLNTR